MIPRAIISALVLLTLLRAPCRVEGQEAAVEAEGESSPAAALPASYTLPEGVELTDGQTFDYIVVGAGAGGAAVAARLALAGYHALLLEAGGDPGFLSKIPAASLLLLGSDLDWQYPTIPNNKSCLASQGQQCRFARGKCLGGSTSINYMLYTRGNKRDYDDLEIPGWSYNDLLPYFLKYEGLQDFDLLPDSSNPYHNTSGIMRIGFFNDSENLWHDRLLKAYKSLKIPFNPDINADSQVGVTQLIGYVHEGERMSAARAFLSLENVKRNLTVATYTVCTGVIIDCKGIAGKVARGITAVQGEKKLSLYARKEVILSAGTIGTSQILLLSGIGPADHLNSMEIPVKADLPVGQNMTDHALPLLIAVVDNTTGMLGNLTNLGETIEQLVESALMGEGPLTSIGLTDLSVFINNNCYDFNRRRLVNVSQTDGCEECDLPNLQIIHTYVDKGVLQLGKALFQHALGMNEDVIDQIAEANKDRALIAISPINLQPKSVGSVRLASRDPLAMPAILANYLDDERDVDSMVRSIKIVEDVIQTKTFKKRGASLLKIRLSSCPLPEEDEEGYWRCYTRHMTYAVFHAVGTTALGGVVDARLRVRGVRALRVADLAVLPYVPRANTEAVAVAIGERCFDFLMQDSRNN